MASQARIHEAYKTVFNSEDGKLVLEDLITASYIRTAVFDSSPVLMAYKEGQRNVVLRVLALSEKPLTTE